MSSLSHCAECGKRLEWASTGRPKRYCGSTCRQRARRARPAQLSLVPGSVPEPLPAPSKVRICRCCGQEMLPRR